MKDRIKYVRTHAGMNQTDFGAYLCVSKSAVQKWESGENAPTNAVITLMCQKTGVDEVWLRTGTGQPFPKKSRRDVIDEYIGQLSEGKRSDLEQLLIEFMAETSVEEWKELSAVFRRLADKLNKPDTE